MSKRVIYKFDNAEDAYEFSDKNRPSVVTFGFATELATGLQTPQWYVTVIVDDD